LKIRFQTRKLEKQLATDKGLKKAYGDLANKIKQRKQQLEAAESLDTISKLPALRLHPYKGNRKDLWSIDIHKNWRILFEIDQETIPLLHDGGVNLREVTRIKIVSIEDPH